MVYCAISLLDFAPRSTVLPGTSSGSVSVTDSSSAGQSWSGISVTSEILSFVSLAPFLSVSPADSL